MFGLLRIFSATDPQGWLAGTLLADGTVAVDADSGSFLVIFLCTVYCRQNGMRFDFFHFKATKMCERAGNCFSLCLCVSFQS